MPFALLDFPYYYNVGDSAIWLGQLQYFKQNHGRLPDYVASLHNLSVADLKKYVPEGPIFLTGGGNFGDVWKRHQLMRRIVLEAFPDRKIVQLPQWVHFSDPEFLKESAAVINKHPDFTLLVRDQKSYELSKKAFRCRVELCPDMAFCIGAIEPPIKPLRPLLLLMREDKEMDSGRGEIPTSLPQGTMVSEWPENDMSLEKRALRRAVLELVPRFGFKSLHKNKQRELFYRHFSQARLNRGVRLLSNAEFVITDRLHTHVLCILLGIPHVRMDTSYGKVSGVAEMWTKELEWVYASPNLEGAMKHYHAFLKALENAD